MLYQRSMEIERRLGTVLRLIRRGGYSTPKLAERLGVSIPTISRCVTALRERGYHIQAEKQARGWRFVLGSMPGARVRRAPGTASTVADPAVGT
jgi:biotin operon repressor